MSTSPRFHGEVTPLFLYLSEMDVTSGISKYNAGGIKYKSGYWDRPKPGPEWEQEHLEHGLETNSRINAFTPHPCVADNCDKSGCRFSSHARGYMN